MAAGRPPATGGKDVSASAKKSDVQAKNAMKTERSISPVGPLPNSLSLVLSPANDLPRCREASRGFGLRKLAPNWKNSTRQLSSRRGESCAKGHPMVAAEF